MFIAAAGNNGLNTDVSQHYPSGYDLPNVVSVASTTKDGKLSSFSNYGNKTVDIAAPGSNILSTWHTGGYNSISGTSMATPHISGALGLLYAKHPELSVSEAREKLLKSAKPHSNMEGKVLSGGVLQLSKLVEAKRCNREAMFNCWKKNCNDRYKCSCKRWRRCRVECREKYD